MHFFLCYKHSSLTSKIGKQRKTSSVRLTPGMIPFQSVIEHELSENLKVYDFTLTSDQMSRINGLNRNIRKIVPVKARCHSLLTHAFSKSQWFFEVLNLVVESKVNPSKIHCNVVNAYSCHYSSYFFKKFKSWPQLSQPICFHANC